MKKMHGYFGWYRTAIVKCKPVDKGCGAGQISCLECGGTGIFEGPDFKEFCVTCKSSGKIYVSI